MRSDRTRAMAGLAAARNTMRSTKRVSKKLLPCAAAQDSSLEPLRAHASEYSSGRPRQREHPEITVQSGVELEGDELLRDVRQVIADPLRDLRAGDGWKQSPAGRTRGAVRRYEEIERAVGGRFGFARHDRAHVPGAPVAMPPGP